jgi:putative redox protein
MPEARIHWTYGKQFVAESGSGHAIVLDTGPDVGGRNTGPTPMELVLMALAGCTGVDVMFILGDKMKKNISSLALHVSGKRSEEAPKIYTEIHVAYLLKGPDLSPKEALRAIRLSAEKYCSVSAMLGKTTKIHSRFEITNETTGEIFSGALEDE